MCPSGPADAWAPASHPPSAQPFSPRVRLTAAGHFKQSLPGAACPRGVRSPSVNCCMCPATSSGVNLCRGLTGCQERCHPGSRTVLCRLLVWGIRNLLLNLRQQLVSYFLLPTTPGRGPLAIHQSGCKENDIYLRGLLDISKMPSSFIFHTRKGFNFVLIILRL